jgi:nucleotide-binding universal stress UspA family protein
MTSNHKAQRQRLSGLSSLRVSDDGTHDLRMTASAKNQTGIIVVGIDGSDQSQAALHWALTEAKVREARIRAINVWNYDLGYGSDVAPMSMLEPAAMEKAARTTLDVAVDVVVAGFDNPPLVERVVSMGSASHELLEEGKRADLLVVGQRGHGGFLGLLLGSVAHQVTHHATCPTVVIPLTDEN